MSEIHGTLHELLTAPQLAKPLQICAYPASKELQVKTRTEEGREVFGFSQQAMAIQAELFGMG